MARDARGNQVWRNDPVYVRRREALKRKAKAEGLPCALCKGKLGPIRFDVDQHHPLVFNADHVVPVAVAIAQGLSPKQAVRGELLVSHGTCNKRRQAKTLDELRVPAADPVVTVEW